MRPMLIVSALGLSFACAGRQAAPSRECSQTTPSRLTIVYARPDMTSPRVETIGPGSKVCADPGSVGFGYHHVKLADGREGYVADDDLMM